MLRNLFDRKAAPALITFFAILFVMEGKYLLRKRNRPRSERMFINSLVAIPSFTLLRLLFLPIMLRLARRNSQWKIGINHGYKAHPFVKSFVAFLLLDYSNYAWHILNHKLPFLWRFHVVHHCDPDLDVTTAARFHFGEMIGSIFFRGACVILVGASALQVVVYEIFFEAANQFHHSNWKLPLKLERALNKVIVTPRMHGIHHSMIRRETDSNFSVIFSWWDRIHDTIRLNVSQQLIATGVPAYSDHRELTAGYLLKLPFTKIRPWADSAENPGRSSLPGKNHMAK